MPAPLPHRIVILGAGFGGLRTALELLKRRVRLGNASVVLIDANAEHVYTPLLYEVAMGCLKSKEEDAAAQLRSSASLAYAENEHLHRKDGRIRFVRAKVEGIDWDVRTVRLAGGAAEPFDDVVLAIGGEAATFGIAGVEEYAVRMKTLDDARRIRRRVAEALRELEGKKRARLDAVVVGAGPNGCEAAGELAFSLRRLARNGRVPLSSFSVTLVDSGPEVLAMFRAPLRAQAFKRLRALGVAVKLNAAVAEVRADGVVLPAGVMPADIVVWAGGTKPRAAAKEWGFPVDERGFVKVDATFAVEGLPRAWALGDCALLKHSATGALAENITRTLERKPTIAFVPPTAWNVVVPLGGAWAAADLGALRLTGFLGYACRKAADVFYFCSVLPLRAALRLWSRGLRGFLRVR